MGLKDGLTLSTFNLRLKFKQPAGTSRGVYTVRDVWYVTVSSINDPFRCGVGECAPLPGLSCDISADYAKKLSGFCRLIEESGQFESIEELYSYPSMLFGFETAFRHFETGNYSLWDTPFARGERGIPINGLIWMSKHSEMLKQIEGKLEAGFKCLKLKIGAINFDEELSLLRYIREHFPAGEVEIRVDANGAFRTDEALEKLKQLSEFELHSIEQPIQAGQWETMAELVAKTPLPIALDEELIGCHSKEIKQKLLETIRPQYIILKPTLHGGIEGCTRWIAEAQRINTGWWVTSALESNIGLNAIAQWCATLDSKMPQGLGTGSLYINNIETPLEVKGDNLWFNPSDDFTPFPIPMKQGKMAIQTSGSTSQPKLISIRKEQMLNSALSTCSKLGLKRGETALLCMNPQYIGSRMMSVRTLVAGLNLTVRDADGNPLKSFETPFDFVAMTPLQVYNSLQNPVEKERLMEIKCLLIGGSSIDTSVEQELKTFPNAVFSSYGMTETVSHIALRRLNGAEASVWYEPFPSINLSLSQDNTLIIDAPLLCDNIITTNDIAELLPDGRFRIIGRKDNVINSGGIKINIESVEEKLRSAINFPFAITSTPDPKFGESAVLLIEKGNDIESVRKHITNLLPKYEQPRLIIEVESIPLTPNGKTARQECKKIANA